MRTVLHVSSRHVQRAMLAALEERGHVVRVEAEREAPPWEVGSAPELLIVEVPAGRAGAERCRRLRDRSTISATGCIAPYVLAVVAPGGGEDAIDAGADSFITGVDGELDAHIALAEQAIERRAARREAEAALADRLWEFSTVADHDQDFIAVLGLDHGFRYAFVNRALAARSGIPAESFVGKATEEIQLPFADNVAWPARLDEAVLSAGRTAFEFEAREGGRVRRYSAAVVPEVTGSGAVAELLVIVSVLAERPPRQSGRIEQRVPHGRRPPAAAREHGS